MNKKPDMDVDMDMESKTKKIKKIIEAITEFWKYTLPEFLEVLIIPLFLFAGLLGLIYIIYTILFATF